jgi:hypothetical protein
MSYFLKINDIDFSMYVNKLVVGREHLYESMNTANGGDLVKYRGSKYVLEVGFVPLDSNSMAALLTTLDEFDVTVSFRDPKTNLMVENIVCIIPNHLVEYYTIRADKVSYKAFSVQILQVKEARRNAN